MSTLGRTTGSAGGTADTDRQTSADSTTPALRARSRSSDAHRAKDVPAPASATSRPLRRCAQATFKSSNRMRHDTPSTARWWIINASLPSAGAHKALSIAPAPGSKREHAASTASSESASTVRIHARASTAPFSGTRSDHPPSLFSARNRRVPWWSSSA
ncbi:Uncharacterised protein [Mycobacteroides abscessus subsp. abscessus]|nr:Uncharacterised protein [Mycobacteroides abscessus subsp. abscessus]